MYVETLLSSLDILRLYGRRAWEMEVWEKGTLHVSRSLPNDCMLECLLEITIAIQLCSQVHMHSLRCCLSLLWRFDEVTFTRLSSAVSRPNKSDQTLSSHASIRYSMLFSRRLLNIRARDLYVVFMLPVRSKPKESTLFGGSSHQRAGCRDHHKLETGIIMCKAS